MVAPGSALSQGVPAMPPALCINEFMASNNSFIADEHQDFDDWIEIYNPSDRDIDLGGCYFSDDVNEPLMWSIPLGHSAQTVVPSHGFLVLWADGETDEGVLHLPFKLSSSGEVILFTAADGTILLDKVEYNKQKESTSYGRTTDGAASWSYFSTPTPGNINAEKAFPSLESLEKYLSYYENRPLVIIVVLLMMLLFLSIWMLFKSKQRLKIMNMEQKILLDDLQEKEGEYRHLVENMNEVIFTLDPRGRYTYVSPKITELTGFATAEIMGKRMIDFIHHNDLIGIQPQMKELTEGKDQVFEYRLLRKDGGIKYVRVSLRAVIKENGLEIITGLMLDITERVIAEKKLEEFATYDYLTGIYNRRIGLTILAEKMKTAHRSGELLTICYTDVNDLKTINDTYGHKEGDHAIVTVVNIIKDSIRDVDVICRMGGDEFMVIFPSCSAEDAGSIVSRIKQGFARYNEQKLKPYTISASFGMVEYQPSSRHTLEELVSLADERMYVDKQRMKDQGTKQ